MRRTVSVWLPNFATDRLRLSMAEAKGLGSLATRVDATRDGTGADGAETPLVVSRHDGHRRVVASPNPAARALGLIPGTTLAQAQMMVPGLVVHPSDPDADRAALERLARWCLRYAPLCAVDAPDGLWIDITGCAHLHRPARSAPLSADVAPRDAAAFRVPRADRASGLSDGNDVAGRSGPVAFGTLNERSDPSGSCSGEEPLLEDLVAGLNGSGFAARAAVADTPGAAHALARHGSRMVVVVLPGRTREALLPLPIAALRLRPDTRAMLDRLGLVQVAQLAAMARAPLARRFGTDTLHRLDQALGHSPEPIVPLLAVEAVDHRLAFEDPLLTAEALAAAIAQLSDAVCRTLDRNGLGARRLDLVFERMDGAHAVRVMTAQPSRDPVHLAHLLAERLDGVDPGSGVEAMHLVVSLHESMRARQLATDGVIPDTLAVLVDRLENRLGPGRVYRTAPIESDVPERSVRRVPALSPPGNQTWSRLARPVRLFDPPQPVETISMLPDRPPVVFTWRHVRHQVRHADGPERIAGEWWRRSVEMRAVRDYWHVEDEAGRQFWLFRAGDGVDAVTGDLRWFLHGLF